jgi:hypothetical protein
VLIAPERPRATSITQSKLTLWEVTLGAVNFSDKMGKFRYIILIAKTLRTI